ADHLAHPLGRHGRWRRLEQGLDLGNQHLAQGLQAYFQRFFNGVGGFDHFFYGKGLGWDKRGFLGSRQVGLRARNQPLDDSLLQ
ncbi:MAG: hypothetical protein C4342_07325, partial [Armatimonadota bacterium]